MLLLSAADAAVDSSSYFFGFIGVASALIFASEILSLHFIFN
jgi:hypothetical protein